VPGSKCTSSKSQAALWQAHHKNMSDKKDESRGSDRDSEKEKERRD